MIAYLTLGTNDLQRAAVFYDTVLAVLGAKRAMVALHASTRAQVDALHRQALASGAKDEGAVGMRGDSFYGGYFRDLDSNKLAICTFS